MPNWIKGVLKLRGKTENIVKFLQNGIHCYVYVGGDYEIQLDREKWCDEYHDEDYYEFIIKDLTHIDGTRRAFVEPQTICFDNRDESIAIIEIRQAWHYDVEQFAMISRKYELNLRAYGIESGIQFCQEFEIINGKITIDKQIQYDDWNWECPFPLMGG